MLDVVSEVRTPDPTKLELRVGFFFHFFFLVFEYCRPNNLVLGAPIAAILAEFVRLYVSLRNTLIKTGAWKR